MNKLFIVRPFIIILVIIAGYGRAFSFNLQTPPPVAKPVQANPAYRPASTFRFRKPTHEDTLLMRDKSISGQYKYLLTKVYHMQEPFVTSFYKNMRDTINADRKKLQEAEAKLAAATKTTTDLQSNVSEKEKSLEQSNARVNSVNFLGVYIDKGVYNLIMWGLVIALGLTAAIVIYRSGSYSREARYRISLYNELEEEFKTYKAKANEKEKKLARELQTERNKVDELMGRS
jgi:Skp family chaperone for outer membrane proteins